MENKYIFAEIERIKVGQRERVIKQAEVSRLASSIKEVGLLSPILIDTEMNLIAGHHRLEACKSLGHEKIQAIIVSMTELERDLAEIDENLVRNELTAFERSEHLGKRKEIYEKLHPETKATIGKELVDKRWNTRAESAPVSTLSFVEDTAEKTGQSTRVIKEDLQIAKNLTPAAKAVIRATPAIADKKTTLLEIAKASPEKQVEIVKKAVDGASANEIKAIVKQQSEVATDCQQASSDGKMNFTNDNIEWAKWSWNPMTGCLHGCKYCYARDIAMRFQGNFDPKFMPQRLSMPANTKIPAGKEDLPGIKNVFVCSMSDLFGAWVKDDEIQSVLKVCQEQKQWSYLFLTKNPARYVNFEFPENCWIGATADTQDRLKKAVTAFKELKHKPQNVFLSCEPLLENLDIETLIEAMDVINWIIVGGQSKSSQCPEFQPDWLWVERILALARKNKVAVYFKPNLTARPREYPI